MLGSVSEREDVVQEGFLRLHRACEGDERIESPRATGSSALGSPSFGADDQPLAVEHGGCEPPATPVENQQHNAERDSEAKARGDDVERDQRRHSHRGQTREHAQLLRHADLARPGRIRSAGGS
ncbi:MAG: hypothetical protein JO321_17470 [Solirubrobacterales bacterium]|nr:hypothetical protein [Solirubrobacterales bacterium]